MSPRVPPLFDEPFLFAHRGASAKFPENTLESFTGALALGTTHLESDVWVTADGRAALAHDDNVGGVIRRQLVSQSQADELPEHVPLLTELYRTTGSRITVSLDIKDPAAIDATVNALREIAEETGDDVVSRAWLCHPSFATVCAWRSRWSDIRLVHSTRLARVDGGAERHANDLFEAGIDAVNFRAPDWTGGLTTLYHKFGIACFGWDAHLTRVARELLDMGCDAVFSNHVDRMLDARREVYGI